MKQVDEARLETDLKYRFEYLSEFIGFSPSDVALIHAAAQPLMPYIPALVEATYARLLSYSATARHFVPRQFGYEGPLPEGVEALGQETEQIRFRKEHLRRYLLSLVGNPYDERMIKYLDVVGKIHTPLAGNKQIDVPLVQMNALMGVLSDVLADAISRLDLALDEERRTLRAFNKLLWIQNDLINRHYAGRAEAQPSPPASAPARSAWR
ncbi:MAG: protoglobin family protein [Pirellulaceae bacterium]